MFEDIFAYAQANLLNFKVMTWEAKGEFYTRGVKLVVCMCWDNNYSMAVGVFDEHCNDLDIAIIASLDEFVYFLARFM
jgi:hypothetical protein